ncbi:uncharacterized protein LOC134021171 isoform X2 [Osmerus eperlanus]|uniref:uncharacterized protein LOC134021171 isoform X2 n=1 Tax=Osmerus eperlanus TaxID=29151 RepID=UPI002E0F4936
MPRARLQLWRLPLLRLLASSLVLYVCLHRTSGMSGWGGCFEGQDVFATVRENSHMGQLVAELVVDTETANGIHWSLTGQNADWFFLEGINLRLNTSSEKVLDREAQGQILMAALTCYEDHNVQLTAVNTLVFSVLAVDADGDTIIYSIDQSSPDADYFKVDLPNSGTVMLVKPLDYETKTQLNVTIYATEMNTPEQFMTSITVTVDVTDGDDQYPQFLPCTLLFQDQSSRICANPVYSVNVTEGEQDIVLDFSPGPIHAVDGDRSLSSPLNYTILSGADNGRFLMDRVTGEVRLTRGVEDRLLTPTLRLRIMAYQRDDPRKYSVATVLIRVLAVNRFPPQFDRAAYRGFVMEGNSPVSLVNTYGNTVLMLHVQDQDFSDGVNHRIQFFLNPTSEHTQFYHVTQDGLLIARTNELMPSQKHMLEVVALDQESGETAQASILVQVLYDGQEVPQGPLGEVGRMNACRLGKAVGLCCVLMSILMCILWAMMHLLRRHWGKSEPSDRGCVAQGKHPNVSLRWFQVVSHRNPMPVRDEVIFHNEALTDCTSTFGLQGKQGIYFRNGPNGGLDPPSKSNLPLPSLSPTLTNFSPALLDTMCAPLSCTPPFSSISSSPAHPSTSPPPSSAPSSPPLQSPAPQNTSPPSPMSSPISIHRATPFHPYLPTLSTVTLLTSPQPPKDSVPPKVNSRVPSDTPTEQDPPAQLPPLPPPRPPPVLTPPIVDDTGTPPPTPESTRTPESPALSINTPTHTAPPPVQWRVTSPSPPETPSEVNCPPPCSEKTHTPREAGAGTGSPTGKQPACSHSGETPGSEKEDEEDIQGDEDAEQNCLRNEDHDREDEELARALERLQPVFLTFRPGAKK